MEAGDYSDKHRIVIPAAKPAELPREVVAQLAKGKAKHLLEATHGTVVLIEKLDRMTWKTGTALQRHLLEHFGLVYRNFLRSLDMRVQGTLVDPVDPLFLTEGARHFDVDSDRAEALPAARFTVKSSRGVDAPISVRYSYMPPRFLGEDKTKERGKTNARFPIRADNNGIIVLRNHRQIDVVSGKRGVFLFNNDDRYVGVELDFPAELDEEFSITTSKQQVVLTDRMWDLLKDQGLFLAVQDMRRRYDEDKKRLRAQRTGKGQPRASEQAVMETDKFSKQTRAERAEQARRGESNLRRKAEEESNSTGRPVEDVFAELRTRTEGREYLVEEEDLRGAPFYRVEQNGGQRTVYLNTLHPFYTKLYKGIDTSLRVRAALEVLLLVVGSCELEASTEERQRFYKQERGEWSSRLELALESLDTYISEEQGVPREDDACEPVEQ